MTIRSHRAAAINYCKKVGKEVSEPKAKYQIDCQFKFDPYAAKDIPGYSLLLERGMYHPVSNPLGVCRDHMVSIEYGWRNQVPSEYISSPHNCQFITNLENVKKGASCCLTVDQLLERIDSGAFTFIENTSISLPKSTEHKKKSVKQIRNI